MRIDCYFTYQVCFSHHIAERDTIIIDVLRASSSIVTALMNGAKSIIPVAKIAAAFELKTALPEALLAGERDGEKLAGFDLGNSPYEFNKQTVAGRDIIICTTNGTQAIAKAAAAKHIWLAALINAKAVADKILQEKSENLALLCSGTLAEPSLDDILTAGAVLYHLNTSANLRLNDSALIALKLYENCKSLGMPQALGLAAHAQLLKRYNHGEDVEYCARENITEIVPWFDKKDGRIYK